MGLIKAPTETSVGFVLVNIGLHSNNSFSSVPALDK
jgi:hypothetical protein